jgi:RNA polymerase sigma-70 factor (ECF subfamily)
MDEATATLVARAREGDERAFEALVRRYIRAARALAAGIVGGVDDADDVVQESFLAALVELESCRDDARFGGWLLRIVQNRARNVAIARARRPPVPLDDALGMPAVAASPESMHDRARLLEALGTLPEIRRTILVLHELQGMSHEELAEMLDISVIASRQHLFQARKALRTTLGEVDS